MALRFKSGDAPVGELTESMKDDTLFALSSKGKPKRFSLEAFFKKFNIESQIQGYISNEDLEELDEDPTKTLSDTKAPTQQAVVTYIKRTGGLAKAITGCPNGYIKLNSQMIYVTDEGSPMSGATPKSTIDAATFNTLRNGGIVIDTSSVEEDSLTWGFEGYVGGTISVGSLLKVSVKVEGKGYGYLWVSVASLNFLSQQSLWRVQGTVINAQTDGADGGLEDCILINNSDDLSIGTTDGSVDIVQETTGSFSMDDYQRITANNPVGYSIVLKLLTSSKTTLLPSDLKVGDNIIVALEVSDAGYLRKSNIVYNYDNTFVRGTYTYLTLKPILSIMDGAKGGFSEVDELDNPSITVTCTPYSGGSSSFTADVIHPVSEDQYSYLSGLSGSAIQAMIADSTLISGGSVQAGTSLLVKYKVGNQRIGQVIYAVDELNPPVLDNWKLTPIINVLTDRSDATPIQLQATNSLIYDDYLNLVLGTNERSIAIRDPELTLYKGDKVVVGFTVTGTGAGYYTAEFIVNSYTSGSGSYSISVVGKAVSYMTKSSPTNLSGIRQIYQGEYIYDPQSGYPHQSYANPYYNKWFYASDGSGSNNDGNYKSLNLEDSSGKMSQEVFNALKSGQFSNTSVFCLGSFYYDSGNTPGVDDTSPYQSDVGISTDIPASGDIVSFIVNVDGKGTCTFICKLIGVTSRSGQAGGSSYNWQQLSLAPPMAILESSASGSGGSGSGNYLKVDVTKMDKSWGEKIGILPYDNLGQAKTLVTLYTNLASYGLSHGSSFLGINDFLAICGSTVQVYNGVVAISSSKPCQIVIPEDDDNNLPIVDLIDGSYHTIDIGDKLQLTTDAIGQYSQSTRSVAYLGTLYVTVTDIHRNQQVTGITDHEVSLLDVTIDSFNVFPYVAIPSNQSNS